MGKKKGAEEEPPKPEPIANKAKDDEEEEDTPVVKSLKEIDVKYCAIETEYELEVHKLRKKYFDEKQAPLIAERAAVLADTTNAPKEDHPYGTPACKRFWLQALQNSEDFAEVLEEWDDDVLEYLHDLKVTNLNDDEPDKGFKLDFVFKENPFFTNENLFVEFHSNFDKASHQPWKQSECIEMKASVIEWKPGKNITVEITQKKTKGGGAKKAKQKAKAKEEDRASFFRLFFRNLKASDGQLPADLVKMMTGGDDNALADIDEDDAEQMAKMFMGQCYDLGEAIKLNIIPYAVRYYTGEAEEGGDSDDEDSESEDEDDDDDDDDDSEDEPPAKSAAKKKAQKKPVADKAGAGEGQKQEECKQQ